MEDYSGWNTMEVGTDTCGKVSRLEDQVLQLLPGIPNEITLDHICTKLPWEAFYVLSSVSRLWLQAIRSHSVHDARVRSCSADTLVVHRHDYSEDKVRIALYSTRGKYCLELPPIPRSSRGIPWSSQCISLDGKLYVVGGGAETGVYDFGGGKEVYMLDLVGQRQWKQCARMQTGRYRFGCGAINSKIYVFGGAVESSPVRGCEVYDPNLNAWSPTMPMTSLRFGHRVTQLVDELFVYGGEYYDPTYAAWLGKWGPYPYRTSYRRLADFIHIAKFMEVYHPVKDEWRVVDSVMRDRPGCTFVAHGKFYLMTQACISVYDTGSESWRHLHTNSFAAIGPVHSLTIVPRATVALDDELLARVYWSHNSNRRMSGVCLLEGKGFGTETYEITWQIVSDCPCLSEDFMYSMQL